MAYENLNKMMCGACGGEDFQVFQQEETKLIVVECKECKSTTEVTVSQPKIELKFGEGSEGILCRK